MWLQFNQNLGSGDAQMLVWALNHMSQLTTLNLVRGDDKGGKRLYGMHSCVEKLRVVTITCKNSIARRRCFALGLC